MKNYRVGKTIGEGSFGKVKIGTHIKTNQKVAIKCINKCSLSKEEKKRISQQIRILKKIQHSNLIQLYQVLEDDKCLYMIMEYASGGDLLERMKNDFQFSEVQVSKMLGEIISSVQYLHSKRIAHRDIKLANILFDGEGSIKITDFGLSEEYGSQEELKTSCGSPCFAAPQVISQLPYDPEKADVWSIGVVLYCLLVGELPFYHHNLKILFKKVQVGEYKQPYNISTSAKHLLKKILEIDPTERISLKEIKSHHFLRLSKSNHEKYLPSEDYFQNSEKKKMIVQILMSTTNLTESQAKKALKQRAFDDIYASVCLYKKMSLRALSEFGKFSLHDLDSQKTVKSIPLTKSINFNEVNDEKTITKSPLFRSQPTHDHSPLKSQPSDVKRFQRDRPSQRNRKLIKSVCTQRNPRSKSSLEEKYIKSSGLLKKHEDFNRDKFLSKFRKENKSATISFETCHSQSGKFNTVSRPYWQDNNVEIPTFKGPYSLSHTIKCPYKEVVSILNKQKTLEKNRNSGTWLLQWNSLKVKISIYSIAGFTNLQIIRSEPFIPECVKYIVKNLMKQLQKAH